MLYYYYLTIHFILLENFKLKKEIKVKNYQFYFIIIENIIKYSFIVKLNIILVLVMEVLDINYFDLNQFKYFENSN